MRISDWSSDVCSSDLLGAMTNGGARYAEVEQPGRWRQDLLPPDRGGNPLERIAALRAAHPGGLGRAASAGGNGVSALADAAVERRKNLRCAGSRRDAVWQGGLSAGHAGPGNGRPVADGAARRSESLDGALLPRRETDVSVR